MSFANVYQSGETVSYRSGLFVMEEGMRGGSLAALSYNASGYLMAANPRPAPSFMKVEKFARPQSFALNVDGQELLSDWEFCGLTQEEEGKKLHATVTLRHAVRPVEVKIHTWLDGSPILERALEVKNLSDKPQAISAIKPLSGGVMQISYGTVRIHPGSAPFRAGYIEGTTWGEEGDFRWHELPDAVYSVCGRYRRNRHRHPMFLLESKLTGEMFVAQLAWSGGYKFDFDLNLEEKDNAYLAWELGQDAPAPVRMLAPGESYFSAHLHFGAVHGDLDDAINAMHGHLKQSVLRAPIGGRTGWIEAGIGPEYNMDLATTLRAVEHAHSVGSEVFFIDAGWYVPPEKEMTDWWKRCGDWKVNRERYPNGIEEVREKAHSLGMRFGMWMDAERVGLDTEFYREHPDLVATEYDGSVNHSGLLNLSDPRAAAWVEEQVRFLLDTCRVDMFRLDYNVDSIRYWNKNTVEGFVENNQARYYENVYDLYRRLKDEYPDVIFENCAGGGGRTDVGMLANFTHTWVTDWQIHPNAFRITNGMTMALPPEFVDRLIGGQTAYLTSELRTQMRNLIFARPSVGVIRPLDAEANPEQMAIIRHYTDLYKTFVRPMHENGKIFHHTPELPGDTASGVGVIELAGAGRGMLGAFRLQSDLDSVRVRMKGADAGKNYLVTLENSGARFRMPGWQLFSEGLTLNLPANLGSELVLYEECE